MINLKWIKCTEDTWCSFFNVNLDHEHFNGFEGVYIIWYFQTPAKVVYVGQGIIKERLLSHRKDPNITQYTDKDMRVTWAKVDYDYRDGIERYLIDRWQPLQNIGKPQSKPIPVSSPWD